MINLETANDSLKEKLALSIVSSKEAAQTKDVELERLRRSSIDSEVCLLMLTLDFDRLYSV